jgi:hypothetical protein
MTKRTALSWFSVGIVAALLVPGCGSDDATTDGASCVSSVEVCDGKDNDCDGQIDDQLTQLCTEGGLSGQQTCTNGQWGACVTQEPQCTPTAEQCDGKDNDCDSAIDEDDEGNALTEPCTAGNGITGTKTCQSGAWGPCESSCTPSPEVCDGKDNDCDGFADEDDTGQPLKQDCSNTCGLGTEICVAGSWQQCTAPQPSAEVCDGVDNDCDDETDEDFECAKGEQAECGTDLGTCEFGTKVCGGTCQWGNCIGGANPGTEVCEGTNDEDCDGTVDNGCGCTNGATKSCCGGSTITCTGGTWPSCPAAPTETCNGLDDDCDDKIDENLPVNPYQLDEDISGISDCAHAKTLGAIWEGDPAQSFSYHLYKPDGTPDRDFFLFRADEDEDLFGCLFDGTNECYTMVVKMTGVPAGVEYDFCVYDVGLENSTATCAAPERKICASAAAPFNQVTMNWSGTCVLDDNRYFYLEVFPKSGSPLSCEAYKFTIENQINFPQEEACSF